MRSKILTLNLADFKLTVSKCAGLANSFVYSLHKHLASLLYRWKRKDTEMNPAQQLPSWNSHYCWSTRVCIHTSTHMHMHPHTSELADRNSTPCTHGRHTHACPHIHSRHSEQSAGREIRRYMLGIQLPRFYIQCCLQPPGDFKHRCLQGPGRYTSVSAGAWMETRGVGQA